AVLPSFVCQTRAYGSPNLSRNTKSMLWTLASSMASLDRWAAVLMRMLWTLWAETSSFLSPAWTRKRSPCLRSEAPKELITSCMTTSVQGARHRPRRVGALSLLQGNERSITDRTAEWKHSRERNPLFLEDLPCSPRPSSEYDRFQTTDLFFCP